MRAKEISEKTGLPPDILQLKHDIAAKINAISDIDELNKIYSFIRKIDLGTGFDAIFAKDEDLKQVQNILSQAIVEANAPFEEKMSFAREMATKGIIDLKKLLNPGVVQNISDVISTKHPELFQQVAPTLLNIAGSYQSGEKKTNKGKGEFFLALGSPKIQLSKTSGDLNIGGLDVEVKAELSRIKGRKGYGSLDAVYSQAQKDVAEFLTKNIKNMKTPVNYSVYIGAKSPLWVEFGPFCIEQGVKPALVVTFLKNQLKAMIKALYLNVDNVTVNALINCVSETGTLDFKEFNPLIKKLAFNYYKNAEGFDGMLIINSNNFKCIYVNNAEQFQEHVRFTKLGFDTGQQNGMQVKI